MIDDITTKCVTGKEWLEEVAFTYQGCYHYLEAATTPSPNSRIEQKSLSTRNHLPVSFLSQKDQLLPLVWRAISSSSLSIERILVLALSSTLTSRTEAIDVETNVIVILALFQEIVR